MIPKPYLLPARVEGRRKAREKARLQRIMATLCMKGGWTLGIRTSNTDRHIQPPLVLEKQRNPPSWGYVDMEQ